jgi:hypothetical protein
MDESERARVQAVVEEWKRRGRRLFDDGKLQRDEYGRRFVEFGAVCYYNCITELEAALQILPTPAPSATRTTGAPLKSDRESREAHYKAILGSGIYRPTPPDGTQTS